MVICHRRAQATNPQQPTLPERRSAGSSQGGPVFLPPRKPSALVWKLLAQPELSLQAAKLGREEGGERLAQSI